MLATKVFLQAFYQALINISHLDPSIAIEFPYATQYNFTKQVLYPSCAQAYLIEPVAKALVDVQKELKPQGIGLKIWDAYRPISVQCIMWQVCPDERYVCPPQKGGRHTRGTAVDVTLIDLKTGKELEMPTEFDDFSEKAWVGNTECSAQALKNKQLLHHVMSKHGFESIKTEWWHFDFHGWQNYPPLEITFEKLMPI